MRRLRHHHPLADWRAPLFYTITRLGSRPRWARALSSCQLSQSSPPSFSPFSRLQVPNHLGSSPVPNTLILYTICFHPHISGIMDPHHGQDVSAVSEGKDSIPDQASSKDVLLSGTPYTTITQAKPLDDDDEDINALIESLESDTEVELEERQVSNTHEPRPIPEEILQTDPSTGLSQEEAIARRKKYGFNKLKEEKKNLYLQFLSYFLGPVQFVMEVCRLDPPHLSMFTYGHVLGRGNPSRRASGLG